MPLFYLNAKAERTFVQTMNATQTAVEELEADHNVTNVFVTPAGEIRVETNVTTAEPETVGESLARWIDADVSFSRASASGRLYFRVNA